MTAGVILLWGNAWMKVALVTSRLDFQFSTEDSSTLFFSYLTQNQNLKLYLILFVDYRMLDLLSCLQKTISVNIKG